MVASNEDLDIASLHQYASSTHLTPDDTSNLFQVRRGVGEMVQRFKALSALPEYSS